MKNAGYPPARPATYQTMSFGLVPFGRVPIRAGSGRKPAATTVSNIKSLNLDYNNKSWRSYKSMRSFLNAVIFTVGVLGFFTYVCIYVTGLSGGGDGGEATGVSPEAGEKIFWGDGQCHTCHSIGTSGSATRGPNQEGLASRAEERAKATGLSSGLEYIVESIVDPNKFIVEGYDKIMPRVYDPPIMLGREKILAVLSYLQTLGGEPDVDAIMKFKDRIPEASKTKVVPWVPPIEVDPKEGEKIFRYQVVKIEQKQVILTDGIDEFILMLR